MPIEIFKKIPIGQTTSDITCLRRIEYNPPDTTLDRSIDCIIFGTSTGHLRLIYSDKVNLDITPSAAISNWSAVKNICISNLYIVVSDVYDHFVIFKMNTPETITIINVLNLSENPIFNYHYAMHSQLLITIGKNGEIMAGEIFENSNDQKPPKWTNLDLIGDDDLTLYYTDIIDNQFIFLIYLRNAILYVRYISSSTGQTSREILIPFSLEDLLYFKDMYHFSGNVNTIWMMKKDYKLIALNIVNLKQYSTNIPKDYLTMTSNVKFNNSNCVILLTLSNILIYSDLAILIMSIYTKNLNNYISSDIPIPPLIHYSDSLVSEYEYIIFPGSNGYVYLGKFHIFESNSTNIMSRDFSFSSIFSSIEDAPYLLLNIEYQSKITNICKINITDDLHPHMVESEDFIIFYFDKSFLSIYYLRQSRIFTLFNWSDPSSLKTLPIGSLIDTEIIDNYSTEIEGILRISPHFNGVGLLTFSGYIYNIEIYDQDNISDKENQHDNKENNLVIRSSRILDLNEIPSIIVEDILSRSVKVSLNFNNFGNCFSLLVNGEMFIFQNENNNLYSQIKKDKKIKEEKITNVYWARDQPSHFALVNKDNNILFCHLMSNQWTLFSLEDVHEIQTFCGLKNVYYENWRLSFQYKEYKEFIIHHPLLNEIDEKMKKYSVSENLSDLPNFEIFKTEANTNNAYLVQYAINSLIIYTRRKNKDLRQVILKDFNKDEILNFKHWLQYSLILASDYLGISKLISLKTDEDFLDNIFWFSLTEYDENNDTVASYSDKDLMNKYISFIFSGRCFEAYQYFNKIKDSNSQNNYYYAHSLVYYIRKELLINTNIDNNSSRLLEEIITPPLKFYKTQINKTNIVCGQIDVIHLYLKVSNLFNFDHIISILSSIDIDVIQLNIIPFLITNSTMIMKLLACGLCASITHLHSDLMEIISNLDFWDSSDVFVKKACELSDCKDINVFVKSHFYKESLRNKKAILSLISAFCHYNFYTDLCDVLSLNLKEMDIMKSSNRLLIAYSYTTNDWSKFHTRILINRFKLYYHLLLNTENNSNTSIIIISLIDIGYRLYRFYQVNEYYLLSLITGEQNERFLKEIQKIYKVNIDKIHTDSEILKDCIVIFQSLDQDDIMNRSLDQIRAILCPNCLSQTLTLPLDTSCSKCQDYPRLWCSSSGETGDGNVHSFMKCLRCNLRCYDMNRNYCPGCHGDFG